MKALLTVALLLAIVAACVGYEHRKSLNPDVSSALSGSETLYGTSHLRRPRRGICGGVLETSSGVITSPKDSHGYSSHHDCRWTIAAPPSHRVVISFTTFHLREDYHRCSEDKVTIYTEDEDGRDHKHGPFCGDRLPPKITSETNKLRLEFWSYYASQYPGFKAVFRTEPRFDLATIALNSTTYPNGSVLLFWAWNNASSPGADLLAGYHLQGTSKEHSFQKTLSSFLTNYTANCLYGYAEYNIQLQPYFKLEDSPTAEEVLGKAATVKVKTPASAPGPPTEVVPFPLTSLNESGRLELVIARPVAWNCQPIGFRVRWEPAQAGEAAWQELEIPDGSAHSRRWTFQINATQSLKPGRHYTLFVSAQGHGDFGDILVGPETSQSVTITPQGPVNLTARPLDSTRAAISWSAPSPADYFLVNLNSTIAEDVPDEPPHVQAQPSWRGVAENPIEAFQLEGSSQEGSEYSLPPPHVQAQPSGCGVAENPIEAFQLEGSSQEGSEYSLPLLGLRPLCTYWVNVKACSSFFCSEVVVVQFEATQEELQAPSFTTVEAVGADSIQLQWELSLLHYADIPQYEVRLYDGETFRSLTTVNTTLRVGNLTAETTYGVEIRAFFEGTQETAPPARTTVTTWSLRPLKPSVDVRFDDGSDSTIVSWTFLNSTVDTLQVDNGEDDWKECSAVAGCKYVVQRGWNSSFKTGFVEVRKSPRPRNYTLLIRGCNSHGCGPSAMAPVKKGVPEADEIAELAYIPIDNSSGLLSWNVWSDHPVEYIVSWKCDNGELFGKTTANIEVEITGLPPERNECTFSVTSFRRLQGGREVHGKSSTITVPFANVVS